MDCIEPFNYTELSKKLTTDINKTEKKNNGIYFTPPETIHKNIEFLKPYFNNITSILEPACGSCEYILNINNQLLKSPEYNNNVNITGIELNNTIFEAIKQYETDNITLINDDYLKREFNTKYDLIIGNPPYFVMKKTDVDKSYYNYFDGRPNIFILFIIKSLNLLNANGIISFVLPKSFLNCLYYDKTRKYIINNYNILNIIECSDDKYIDTQQNTILLIIQNSKNNKPNNNLSHTLNITEYTIFGTLDNIKQLKSLYHNSKTLYELGFTVSVGNVVWNQCKSCLTDDNKKTLLIYSSDISNNKLAIKKYNNGDKKNYINKKGINGPLLVINRGYGVGTYHFNYCLINETFDYLIENHLICIKYNDDSLSNDELIVKYNQIINSFDNEKTSEFIDIYFGNNAINTTELYKTLPIYDI